MLCLGAALLVTDPSIDPVRMYNILLGYAGPNATKKPNDPGTLAILQLQHSRELAALRRWR